MHDAICPKFDKAMQLISKRWTGLIIHQLLDGPKRFSQLEAAMPISGRLLSERLKELEQEGIVHREVYPETPVRIEYSLTTKGCALGPLFKELEHWSHEWVTLDDADLQENA
ncbi:DNA-binding HxlR family transcriptional regulator [Paenibacillus phyllosphaerae]|uniref:DNA-binding HxlR family transcriptional regulator n=1 Tax=Paenibacillus phyllosphaerae TaxID=274593 RepID=A0A7W5FPX1_9BACL|nr:winged helix-turn-helix transcriptional regulator [Paenibacillus phyllosphaerae]MBB3112678.1 DNA-binding HxlR family transcriptional regulator [Paenibacillus phyllosphaerae]